MAEAKTEPIATRYAYGDALLELGEAERERMAERFRTTSRYEWMFWDMGWRREAWPL
jgi:thiaminase